MPENENSLSTRQRLEEYLLARNGYYEAKKEFTEIAPRLFAAAREELALSQAEIAERLDVDNTYISKIEHGKTRPSEKIIEDLVALLT